MSDLKWNGWIVEKNGTIREFYSGEAARVEHRAEKKQFPWWAEHQQQRLKLDVISDSVCVRV